MSQSRRRGKQEPRTRPCGRSGAGTPRHGGFVYYEVLEILQSIAKRCRIVGVDLVEVAPAYDPAGVTSVLAAQVLLNLLGFTFEARRVRGW